MRVIAGTARGIPLKQVPSGVARASLGRVRQSLFSWLADRVEGAMVLDLFAGTGSLGIEALSRGARAAVFVDNSRDSVTVLRDNLERTHFADRAEVVLHNALTVFRGDALEGRRFGLVFVDPPYALLRDARLKQKFARIMEELAVANVLADDGWVVVKHEQGVLDELAPCGLELAERRCYRHAEVSIYRPLTDDADAGPAEAT